MQHRVVIQDRPIQVEVFEESQVVWVAKGKLRGISLCVRGKTEMSALCAWRNTATWHR